MKSHTLALYNGIVTSDPAQGYDHMRWVIVVETSNIMILVRNNKCYKYCHDNNCWHQLLHRCVSLQEAEIARIEDELRQIENGAMSTEIPEDLVTTELAAMRAENAKLKYRINVLDRVCYTGIEGLSIVYCVRVLYQYVNNCLLWGCGIQNFCTVDQCISGFYSSTVAVGVFV